MTAVFDYILKPPVGYEKLKKRRILLIVLYVGIALVGIGTGILTWHYGLFFPSLALAAGIDLLAIAFTWRKTKPEYEYLVEAGEFSFSAIYGGKTRRTILTLDLTDAELIAPANGLYDSKLRDFAPQNEIFGVFTDEQKNYFMLFRNENDEPTVFYFHADSELVRVLRKYNAKTVVVHKIES